MASIQEQLAPYLVLIPDSRATSYGVVASGALLGYELFALFPDEVKLIWKKQWNVASLLYIFVRYVSIGAILFSASYNLRVVDDDKLCKKYLQTQTVLFLLISVTADGVLALRLWILYRRNMILLFGLSVLVLGEMIVVTYVVMTTLTRVRRFWHLGEAVMGCHSIFKQGFPWFFKSYAVIFMGVAILLFLLCLYKCGRTILGSNRKDLLVVNVFLRDSFLSFLAILACSIAQAIVLMRARTSLSQVMMAPTFAIHAVACCRILMNMKRLVVAVGADKEKVTGTFNVSTLGTVSWQQGTHFTTATETSG
jgi:hypothetical protein